MANGLADHTTPPRCAMQLGSMLRLEDVEGNGNRPRKPRCLDGAVGIRSKEYWTWHIVYSVVNNQLLPPRAGWFAPRAQVTPPESHYKPRWIDVFTGAILIRC